MNKNKNNKKLVVYNIFYILLIIITAIIFSTAICLKNYFSSTTMEQLLYNTINMHATVNMVFMDQFIAKIILVAAIFSASILLPIIVQNFIRIDLSFKIKNKEIRIFPINLKKYSLSLCIASIVIITLQLKIPTYIYHQAFSSKLYEKHYVPYTKENVVFPEKKRNLIMIFVESLENSGFSIENGGIQNISYIPNLEQLALQNINFSNTNELGGFKIAKGTNWTVAGLVAQTSGIPINIQTTNKENKFLTGVTSIGDILEENGYKNYITMGSNSSFGDRDKYFKEHGNYTIYDYDYAKETGYIPANYYKWWGFEDQKLYAFAREKLTTIAKNKEPFNFTMLTADTHFFDGFVSNNCPSKFDSHYANSYYCTDMMLYNFIEWIKRQDFYENTTIVITGDHLTMRDDFYKAPRNYDRTAFNLFINSQVEPINTKNREFTSMDIYPTTLASLGIQIRGNRLGLGTNLFSNQKTIAEEIGFKKLNQELQKRSNYYTKNIIK